MMKNNRKILIAMFAVVFVIILAACENSSEGSSTTVDNQSQINHLAQNTKDNSTNADSAENASNTDNIDTDTNDTNEKLDPLNHAPAKDKDASATNTTVSLKEEYLKKLNDTKKEMEEIRRNSKETNTYAMKKVEGDRYDSMDQLLNEVYGVLKEQLSTDEMDQLRNEQRTWIKYRDDTAKEASLKYKGGTEEHLEYVTVLANLTEERCFELVEEYMK